MDDYIKKFKELAFKGQLGVYAGIAIIIGSFLAFASVDFYLGSVSVNIFDADLGFLVPIGGAAGAVFLILGQRLNAFIGFAVAAAITVWNAIDILGETGVGIGIGAILLIAGCAVGIWATIDAFLNRNKAKA